MMKNSDSPTKPRPQSPFDREHRFISAWTDQGMKEEIRKYAKREKISQAAAIRCLIEFGLEAIHEQL